MDPNKHTVLFVRFDSLRPTNNLSVIKGRVFLGLTSTKLGLMFVAVMPVRLEPGAPRSRVKHFTTDLPKAHCNAATVTYALLFKKQCRSRLAGFLRSQLIRIHTVSTHSNNEIASLIFCLM